MSILSKISDDFSAAFDSIITTKIYYRDNNADMLQAGLITLLPQMAAYLLEYNKEFGIKIGVKLENYPLLLFVVLVVALYVLAEPKLSEKKSNDVFGIVMLSVHIFAFALSLNLIYSVSLQVFGISDDFIRAQIANAATLLPGELKPSAFAAMYGIPFLAASVAVLFANSKRYYKLNSKDMNDFIRLALFWRSLILAVVLSIYQYMAFILIGAIAS